MVRAPELTWTALVLLISALVILSAAQEAQELQPAEEVDNQPEPEAEEENTVRNNEESEPKFEVGDATGDDTGEAVKVVEYEPETTDDSIQESNAQDFFPSDAGPRRSSVNQGTSANSQVLDYIEQKTGVRMSKLPDPDVYIDRFLKFLHKRVGEILWGNSEEKSALTTILRVMLQADGPEDVIRGVFRNGNVMSLVLTLIRDIAEFNKSFIQQHG